MPRPGLEPGWPKPKDFKSFMSTNFIIEALQLSLVLYMNWYLLSLNLAAGVGIEPTQRALETRVLPLDEPAILY